MFDEIIAPLFETEWGRRIGWGLMICMALILLYTAIAALFTLKSAFFVSQKPTVSNNITATDDATKLIAQIPDQHLFGKLGVINQSALLPVTSLQLHLVGVIKAEPEQFSRVIIAEGSKTGKVYQVGDSVTSGVSVYAISADAVVLQNGGRLEKLPLQRIPLMFQGMPKSMLNDEKAQEE